MLANFLERSFNKWTLTPRGGQCQLTFSLLLPELGSSLIAYPHLFSPPLASNTLFSLLVGNSSSRFLVLNSCLICIQSTRVGFLDHLQKKLNLGLEPCKSIQSRSYIFGWAFVRIGFNEPISVNIFERNWWNSSASKSNWLHVDIFQGIFWKWVWLHSFESLNVQPLPHCQTHYCLLINYMFINQKLVLMFKSLLWLMKSRCFTWAHFWYFVCRLASMQLHSCFWS